MKTFVYVVLLLVALMIFKAFYWDAHHSSGTDANATTVEVNASDESNGTNPHAGEPLTEVGDTIAGKIKGKIQTH